MEILVQSNVKLEGAEVDFGEVRQNSKIETTLTFKGENLSNFEAVPGCRCTTTAPKVINSSTIELEVGYRDSDIKGAFKKTITLNYREKGVKQTKYIKIKGTIN
jgi:hypothetical protein